MRHLLVKIRKSLISLTNINVRCLAYSHLLPETIFYTKVFLFLRCKCFSGSTEATNCRARSRNVPFTRYYNRFDILFFLSIWEIDWSIEWLFQETMQITRLRCKVWSIFCRVRFFSHLILRCSFTLNCWYLFLVLVFSERDGTIMQFQQWLHEEQHKFYQIKANLEHRLRGFILFIQFNHFKWFKNVNIIKYFFF